MNKVGPGVEAFKRICERLSISVTADPPQDDLPNTVLGQPLDPTLRAIYSEHDGLWWSAPEFSLRVYPLEGPDALEWRNISLRNSGKDFGPPYPFDDLLAFAQYGRQASYLAVVPELRDEEGRQPVLFVDTNEDVWAVPLAANVDAAFAVLAQYLEHATMQHGRAGLLDLSFPLECAGLIAEDKSLTKRVASGQFKKWLRGDASI